MAKESQPGSKPPAEALRGRETGHPEQRLEDRTIEELYALAAELRIAGHTEMSKSELIEAIRRR